MTKLEKSIRHEMAGYGPGLRAGHYNAPNHAGFMTKYGTIAAAFCDVEDGIVTDIRLYDYSEGRIPQDYYKESCEITDAFYNQHGTGYFDGNYDWDDFIEQIVDIVKAHIAAKKVRDALGGCENCAHHDVFWKGSGCNLMSSMEPCRFDPKENTDAEGE